MNVFRLVTGGTVGRGTGRWPGANLIRSGRNRLGEFDGVVVDV
jgi:hypothetical protein